MRIFRIVHGDYSTVRSPAAEAATKQPPAEKINVQVPGLAWITVTAQSAVLGGGSLSTSTLDVS
jgi:hypothetical protein